MSRSLILACSRTKRNTPGTIPAMDRYDGPAFKTVRANINPSWIWPPLILSAEHGLIDGLEPIADYDRLMTAERVRELVDDVAAELRQLVELGSLGREIFAFGGGVYRDCLEQARVIAEAKIGRGISIDYSSGGIGEQLGQLKAWLRRDV